MSDDPRTLDGKLEPEAKPEKTLMDACALSIAISLKRIADYMERSVVTVTGETEDELQDYLERLARLYGVGG